MAITFTLISRGSNHVEYNAQSSGSTNAFDTGTIQAQGVGDADYALEDAVIPNDINGDDLKFNVGLIKQVVDVTGVTTQARARRQMLDYGLAPQTGDGILNVAGKRCRVYVVPICPVGEVLKNWSVDADTDGDGRGEINVCCTAAGAARARVIIEAIGTPLQF